MTNYINKPDLPNIGTPLIVDIMQNDLPIYEEHLKEILYE